MDFNNLLYDMKRDILTLYETLEGMKNTLELLEQHKNNYKNNHQIVNIATEKLMQAIDDIKYLPELEEVYLLLDRSERKSFNIMAHTILEALEENPHINSIIEILN